MRQTAILLILALALGCGGDEYATENPETNGGGDAAETPGAAPTPAVQMASKEATELTNAYSMAKNAAEAQKVALQQAANWAGKTLPGDAYYFLGMLYELGEDWGNAADAFTKFVQNAPGDKNEKWGLYRLVDVLVKADRAVEAGKHATAFGQKYPEEVKYWRSMENTLAENLAAKGDVENATPHLGKAFELGDYYSGEEWVMALAGLGKYDEARTAAGKLSLMADGEKEQARAKAWVARAAMMGKPAPALDITAWASPDDYDLEKLTGRVVLLYFWTTGDYGTATRNERNLKPLWDKHASDDFMIVGLSKHDKFNIIEQKTIEEWTTEDEIQNVRNWVFSSDNWLGKDNKTPWALGLVQGPAAQDSFGYGGINPTYVVIGKKGNYRYYRQGHDPKGYVQLDWLIGKLSKE